MHSAADCAPYRFDLEARSIVLDGVAAGLTPKDYELALFLFSNPGSAWSREHLLSVVWGTSAALETRTVDAHVSRIRRTLDLASGRTGWRLVSVMKQGYRLDRLEPDD